MIASRTARTPDAQARLRHVATAVSGVLLVAYLIQQTLLYGSHPAVDHAFDVWVYNALGITAAAVCWIGVRRHTGASRTVWTLAACALSGFAAGNFVWTVLLEDLPEISIADPLWLASFLPLYAALVVCVRDRVERFHSSVWLDGGIAAAGATALVGALLWPTLREASQGQDPVAVMVNLGYPLADLLMAALLVAVAALLRGRLGRPLAFLLAGMLLSACADVLYLVKVAAGAPDSSPLFNVVEVGANVVMALGVLQPERALPPARLDGWRVLVLPGGFALAAAGLLSWAALGDGPAPAVPTLLALGTLAAVAVRAALTFREYLSLVDAHAEARTDHLTGLLNRRGFFLACEAEVEAARARGRSLGLLLLDLDRFKELNDTFGHQRGDEVLVEVADRLARALGGATLARLGGDEFAVLVAAGPDGDGARDAGRAMLEALEGPFAVDGTVTRVAASVGLAVFPGQAGDREELLRHADAAMYRAKRHRSGLESYVAEADDNVRDRIALAGDLHEALERDELVLHFQPKSDLRTGAVAAVESLVRWQHPRRGLLYPDAFIPLAEQHGLMRALTLHVLDLSLRQRAAWAQRGLHLQVAVNISPANLLDARFPADVKALAARWALPAGGLQLEITEATVMVDPERALDALARLSELGITFALDDFGTGYSSLAQLKRLPVSALKIDRSFVMDMTARHEDATIVRSIVELGRNLGLQVIAEGVETAEHWDALARLGCDSAQGYFLSRPQPADALTRWLRERAAQPRPPFVANLRDGPLREAGRASAGPAR